MRTRSRGRPASAQLDWMGFWSVGSGADDRHNEDSDGVLRGFEVTPGISSYRDFLIMDEELVEGELTSDARALKERVSCIVWCARS